MERASCKTLEASTASVRGDRSEGVDAEAACANCYRLCYRRSDAVTIDEKVWNEVERSGADGIL